MNALIENFHLLAAAPNGVAKLREFILQLAITGRLLPQDSRDQAVAPLVDIKRISRKHPAEKLLVEFPLPDTWTWVSIADLCELRTGATPSTSRSEYYGGNIRWLVSGDIHKQKIIDCEGRITELGLQNSNCKILPVNSVLIALNGQGKTRATVALLKVPAACNQSLVAITPIDETLLLPEFIFLNLRYRYFEIRDITGQKQRRGLNMGLVGDLSVSVAPLAEQQRIVAKVDELMRLCDQLEAQQTTQGEAHERLAAALLDSLTQSADAQAFTENWARLAEHFELLFDTPESIAKLKQTLLQLAVQGKLVPQDANDEPASELLNKIVAEKARLIKEGKIRKDKPLLEISEGEKPYVLPQGWVWSTLSEVALINPRNEVTDDLVASFVPMAMIGTSFNGSHDQEKKPWKEIKKGFTHFADGDISVAKITPCFENSKACVFSGLENGVGAGTTELHVIRPVGNGLNPRYVLAYLKAPEFLLVGEGKMTGTAGQKRLPKEFVQQNPFPLPPLAEQHRIVAKVDELMQVCDVLAERLTRLRDLAARLAETLVQSA